jgi:hypothetical protein
MTGKRVQFDPDTWSALELLAKDRMQDFQELADEAFADLLRIEGPGHVPGVRVSTKSNGANKRTGVELIRWGQKDGVV